MFAIEFTTSADRSLRGLPEDVQRRIVRAVESLSADPRPRGCVKLAGAGAFWRTRVGEYRVIYTVDDDNSMRLFCASVLRHNNLDAKAFATPEEALHALHDFTPDVILADLYMPQISGFELLHVHATIARLD